MAEGRSEPSMDEILSSIKRIIADDDRAPAGAVKKAPPAKLEPRATEEILELTRSFDEAPNAEVELLDDNKAQSLRHSFSTLQTLAEPGTPPQIVRSGETSLEGMARDLLRPMLKEWLDSNLPALVETMVEREIARITKKN